MRVHHLSCGSLCPYGGRLLGGEGGLFSTSEIVCHCLLVETATGLVLVDTGFGTGDVRNPRQVGAALRAAMRPRLELSEAAVTQIDQLGFDPDDVRHIVLTHLDVDHAGGLPDFPRAEVHVFAPELEAAMSPALRERSRYIPAHWQHGPRWVEHRSAEGGDDWFGFESVRVVPGLDSEVLLIPLVGHSRGHCGIAVHGSDGWLLHCGDAYFNHREVADPPSCPPGLRAFQRLTASDYAARSANLERLRELASTRRGEVDLFCSHDPHYLEKPPGPEADTPA